MQSRPRLANPKQRTRTKQQPRSHSKHRQKPSASPSGKTPRTTKSAATSSSGSPSASPASMRFWPSTQTTRRAMTTVPTSPSAPWEAGRSSTSSAVFSSAPSDLFSHPRSESLPLSTRPTSSRRARPPRPFRCWTKSDVAADLADLATSEDSWTGLENHPSSGCATRSVNLDHRHRQWAQAGRNFGCGPAFTQPGLVHRRRRDRDHYSDD